MNLNIFKSKWSIAVGIVALLIVYNLYLNSKLKINKYSIKDSRIPDSFNGYKILQISDFHNRDYGDEQEYFIKKVKEAESDIIVITGDFIDRRKPDVELAVDTLKALRKINPVYFVSGNHEGSSIEYYYLKRMMKELDIVVLENEYIDLNKNKESIKLLGLDDPRVIGEITGSEILKDKLGSMADEIGNKDYKILLSHRPEFFKNYVANNIDLVLSGHTHGGQVRIPIFGGILAPNQGFFPKYLDGKYEEENTTMIISKGIGYSSIKIRTFNQPELVLVELNNAEVENGDNR